MECDTRQVSLLEAEPNDSYNMSQNITSYAGQRAH